MNGDFKKVIILSRQEILKQKRKLCGYSKWNCRICLERYRCILSPVTET